jgi:hypothetical protein
MGGANSALFHPPYNAEVCTVPSLVLIEQFACYSYIITTMMTNFMRIYGASRSRPQNNGYAIIEIKILKAAYTVQIIFFFV